MSKNLYNRYLWLIETIKRRGRITRHELDERWRNSSFSDGNTLCRRTLYNYRNAILELFSVDIKCDPATYEYYIDEEDAHNRNVTDWLLNSKAVNDALTQARDISDRIFLEDIPSARDFLGPMIDAIRQGHRVRFNYHSYSRSRPSQGVLYEPYFLKIFKQRWYVVGRHVQEKKLKTYALDRMASLTLEADTFAMPPGFDPEEYFRHAFGIIVTKGSPRKIAIRCDHHTAHYLRDLPLHDSQQEVVHDGFSIFYYRMLITPDLVNEILGYGSRLTVLEPPELRTMLVEEYRNALANYGK